MYCKGGSSASHCSLLLPKHVLLWVFNPNVVSNLQTQTDHIEFLVPSTNQLFHYFVEVKIT